MTLVEEIEKYVAQHIPEFHTARLAKLQELKLSTLLKKKNPYLFKAKDLATPQEIVEALASAFMSSAEESIFGNWLEQLAIFVASKTYDGRKSACEGVDLEMDKDGVLYLVSIKSGPKWSNSSSKAKLKEYFRKATRVYRTSGNHMPCNCIEGCCYGREQSETDTHTKICGQAFWEFISGVPTLYTDIITPLATRAKECNELYRTEYTKVITCFTRDFINRFAKEDGSIDWDSIVALNSGQTESRRK